jgi:hypothetical protein
MKKFKIALWLLLIILLVMVFFQNKALLLEQQGELMIDFFVAEPLQSAPLPIGAWLLIALCAGFLIAYLPSLVGKIKTGRTIKALKAQGATQAEMITQLKNELETRVGYQTDEVQTVKPGGSTITEL